MKILIKTLKDNSVILGWFGLLILFLLLKTGPPASTGSLLKHVLAYWSGHAGFLFSALGNTLVVAFPVAAALLVISFGLALAAAYKPRRAPWLAALVILISLLPSVYFVHLVRIIYPGAPVNSEAFAGFALVFSNLVMYFFFLAFKKDIYDEFQKDYHFLTRQLGIRNKLVSARQKLGLILLERFLPLFIMVFSSTIFVESKLNIKGGIYTFFYDTVKSIDIGSRPDIFWGQLLFILVFVILLQVLYRSLLNYVKTRYF